ncbi:TadE/TadG family type IV pilus assembly protein [Methylobacterium sp. J-090]|uniref:TadE/TadG family type IV pilus assembly protein n=1 Tax=Methylobacterium sp. J-090 TaxID=2836666 RepID=UPI001FBB75C2|nr:Tad domain-containing protein [Methylobacterium sp. J-090]MCJ2082709.1 Tad domain-containing protein [Methylobacterium sp. J-090]
MAILFILMAVPILFASGAAVDYGRRNAAKVQLDASLDAAVLALMAEKTNTISAASIANAETQFRTEASKLSGVTITSFVMVPVPVNATGQLGVTATYGATVKTTLSSMMQVAAMPIAGRSGGERTISQYTDFYLLLDNSPSMGLGATQADIDNLTKLTAKQTSDRRKNCAFACHETKVVNGKTVDDTDDNYYLAKKNNIKLRIDNLREATQSLVDTAVQKTKFPNQYRMAIYTFSDIFTEVAPLTTTLSTVRTSAGKIDLAYSYPDDRDTQTSYIRALPQIAGKIPNSGSGVTADAPIRFLFFVTDGVQDAVTDGKVMGPYDKKTWWTDRFLGAIDPALCTSMKNRNIRIGVIYTTYLPLPNNDFYKEYVAPVAANIPENLRQCASDGLFFPVSTGGDINTAMQKLFEAALASTRITR